MGIGDIVAWVLFGLVIGLVARLLHPGRDPMGWFATIALGVVGSMVGGFIAYALRLGTTPYAPAGFIMSVVGGIIALVVYYSALGGRRRI